VNVREAWVFAGSEGNKDAKALGVAARPQSLVADNGQQRGWRRSTTTRIPKEILAPLPKKINK
jgi:hypothetical protein